MQLQGINKPEKIFIGFLTLVTLLALLIPLLYFINPQKQRALQFDQQRIDRILSISYEVNGYYSNNNVLPTSLDFITYSTQTKDPETGGDMEYRVVNATKYDLCFTFALNSAEDNSLQYKNAPMTLNESYPQKTSLAHDAGYDCIMFTVSTKNIVIQTEYPTVLPTKQLPE